MKRRIALPCVCVLGVFTMVWKPIGLAQVSNPAVVGSWPGFTPGPAFTVTVSGNHAYAGGNGNLQVFDISNPASPRIVGGADTPGTARNLAVSEDYLYVAAGEAGMQVFDISQPAHPRWVGGSATSGDANAVVVSGNHAYVADGDDGLWVIDATDKANPQALPSIHTSGYANGVAVSGDYALVAAGTLDVFRIVDAANPEFLTTVDPGWPIEIVAVSGGYAYVAQDSGLGVIDFSDPDDIRLRGQYAIPEPVPFSVFGLAVSGDYAYLAGGVKNDPPGVIRDALTILNITDPDFPFHAGWFDDLDHSEGLAYAVAVSGTYAFLPQPVEGLVSVIDVSATTDPQRVAAVATVGGARNAVVSGPLAYVVANGIQIIDVSDPTKPEWVGGYRPLGGLTPGGYLTSGTVTDVAISDNHAVLTESWVEILPNQDPWFRRLGRLEVVDVSNPARPRWVGETFTRGEAWAVAVSGDYAYVAESWEEQFERHGALEVINMSNRAVPQSIKLQPTGRDARDVLVSGNYAFAAADEFSVFDISNPANPQLLSSLPANSSGLAVAGDRAYSLERGLQIIDISNPADPMLLGEDQSVGRASAVVLSGAFAYVAEGASGLRVIDVRDPANLMTVGSNSAFDAQGVFAQSDRVYVASGEKGLLILNTYLPAPRFEGPFTLDASGFHFRLRVESGQSVRVQWRSDLAQGDWETWQTVFGTGNPEPFVDAEATAERFRFYRTISP
jgi:hypothetical protein